MPESKLYISKITLPDGKTYDIKDAEARDLIAQLSAGSLAFVKATDASTTPEGVTWDNAGTTVTGSLEAAEGTKGKIYLVPAGTVKNRDIFEEYVTVSNGSALVWEKLGDTEMDFSSLGALAYVDSVAGSITISTADSASFTNGAASVSGAFTPAGTVAVSLSQTDTAATLTKGDYTPAGSVSVNLDQTATSATLTKSDYTPEGSVSKPSITVTPTTDTVEVKKTAGTVSAGSAASFTQGSDSYTAGSKAADTFVAPVLTTSVANETLTIGFSQGSFTEGAYTPGSFTQGTDTFSANTPTSVTLPTFEEKTFLTAASAELASAPVFTGTKATDALITAVSYDKASVESASFTGTESKNILVTAVNYDKAAVSSASFTGTEGTVNATGTATGDVSLTKTNKTVDFTAE